MIPLTTTPSASATRKVRSKGPEDITIATTYSPTLFRMPFHRRHKLAASSRSQTPLPGDLLRLIAMRRGHFEFESGKHGETWLDLDALFARPEAVQPFA